MNTAKQLDTSALAWYAYVWVNCEYIICNYLTIQCIQTGIFFITLTTIFTIANAGHVKETNRIIWKLIGKCRTKNLMLPSIPLSYRMIIANHLREHNGITYIVIACNRELFGYINYIFLLTNIPINVYILRRNLFKQQILQDQILLWSLSFIQFLLFLIVFIPPSWCYKVFHSPAKFIPILQPMLRGSSSWIRYKMKCEDLYHRLTDNGPKLALTVGPVRAITYMTSFEV